MIKQLLTVIAATAMCQAATAQITVTMAEMPVSGDTPRHSIVNPVGATLGLSNTGANITWDYSTLVPVAQTIDTYKTASQAGYSSISGNPTGFKIADTLDLGAALPITLTNAYTFFTTSASSYSMTQLAAKGGLLGNMIVNYSNPDEMVNFPLTFNRIDTTTMQGSYSNILLGISLSIKGVRYSHVDGWGTLVTPHSNSPESVLRLRSEVIETDSIELPGQPAMGFVRHNVTYQWFALGVRTPLLMITTDATTAQETPVSVMFMDHYRPELATSAIPGTQPALTELTAYPNPSASGVFQINIPAEWKTYTVEVYDMAGKLSATHINNATLDIKSLPSGNYTVRVSNGSGIGFVRIAK